VNRLFLLFAILYLIFPGCVSASHSPAPKVVIFACPKCGTHLATKVIHSITKATIQDCTGGLGETKDAAVRSILRVSKYGRIVVTHPWSDELEVMEELIPLGYKAILVIRDPRDQMVSLRDWLLEGQWFWACPASIKDPDALLEELINGQQCYWQPVVHLNHLPFERIRKFPEESHLIIRFESLVGAKGNGSEEEQDRVFGELAAFLGIEHFDPKAIDEGAYGESWTFRVGQIGRWKQEFSDYHKALFKEMWGDLLIELGYEKDLNW
jgi:hypothetical protein